ADRNARAPVPDCARTVRASAHGTAPARRHRSAGDRTRAGTPWRALHAPRVTWWREGFSRACRTGVRHPARYGRGRTMARLHLRATAADLTACSTRTAA